MTSKPALAIESLMQTRGKTDSVLKKGHRVDHDNRDCSGLALSARLTHPDEGAGGEWFVGSVSVRLHRSLNGRMGVISFSRSARHSSTICAATASRAKRAQTEQNGAFRES